MADSATTEKSHDRIPQREVAPPSHSQDAPHVRDQLPDNPEHGEDDGG